MNDTIITARDIHKTYTAGNKEVVVLKGINFSIKKGELISIVGPSGAGKSTLLYILSTLDVPTKGDVLYGNCNILKIKEKEKVQLRRKMGFVFQFYHLLPEFSIIDNVCLAGAIGSNLQGKPFREKAKELLIKVGLKDRLHHRPDELSGGERQRAAIARALINDPEIIFADEPTGNLDSQAGRDVQEILININREQGKTIIVVTHNQKMAEVACRRWHIVDGTIKE